MKPKHEKTIEYQTKVDGESCCSSVVTPYCMADCKGYDDSGDGICRFFSTGNCVKWNGSSHAD